MITAEVIKEIYQQFDKPPRDEQELELPRYLKILEKHHRINDLGNDNGLHEVIVEDLEEFNPFRRFLVRSLHGILEFDHYIAFVFRRHILFFSKDDENLQVHIKPEEKKRNIFARLFGTDDDD